MISYKTIREGIADAILQGFKSWPIDDETAFHIPMKGTRRRVGFFGAPGRQCPHPGRQAACETPGWW